MYAWEPWFETKVDEIRDKEMVGIKDRARLNTITSITIGSAPYMVSFL